MTDARPPAAVECAERDARVENGGRREGLGGKQDKTRIRLALRSPLPATQGRIFRSRQKETLDNLEVSNRLYRLI